MSDVLTFDNLETEKPEEGVLDFRDLIHDAEQKKLEAEGPAAWAGQPKTGFLGAFGKGFIEPMQATGRGPGLAVLSHDTLKEHLLDQYARKTTEPQMTPGGRAGSFLGGLAGNIAQALPVAKAAGTIGLMAQFGSASAYDEFLNAGMRALQEGKSPDEATTIGREAALAGLGVGAALGAIMPGAGGGAKELLKTSLKLGGVAGAGRVGENITEKALGLKTPVTEGALREALVMGLMPPGMKLAGAGLQRLVGGLRPPPLPTESPRVPPQLPERTGPIIMGDVPPPPTMSQVEEQLRNAPSLYPRELPPGGPRALLAAPPIRLPDAGKPPKTLAEVEEFLRNLPPEEPPPQEGGVPVEPAPKPPAPAPPAAQPAAPAAQPKEANAVAPRIVEESRQPEHPGVAQRPAVSPDQPEVRQVEGGQAGGGNRPVGEPKKEESVLLTRDWDLFSENLADDLESFADTRGTGKRDYDMQDVADRFVDYAKQDKSGKPLDELVSDFAKSDEASAGQIRKLRQSVKSVMAKEPVAEPAPVPTAGKGKDDGSISSAIRALDSSKDPHVKEWWQREISEREKTALELGKSKDDPVAMPSTLSDSERSYAVTSEKLIDAQKKLGQLYRSDLTVELAQQHGLTYGTQEEKIARAEKILQAPDLESLLASESGTAGVPKGMPTKVGSQRLTEPRAPKPKEAWEMTLKEYHEASARHYIKINKANLTDPTTGGKSISKGIIKDWTERLKSGEVDYPTKKQHKDAVEKALAEGKPVPPEVLKDYPELQPKEAPPAQPTTPAEGVGKGVKTPAEIPLLNVRWAQSHRMRKRQADAFKAAGIPLRTVGSYTLGSKAQMGLIPDTPEARALAKKVGMTVSRRQWGHTGPAPAATEGGGKAPGKRRKTLKEIREQNKLGGEGGFITIPPVVVDKIERLRDQIATAWRTGKVRAAMTYTKDAAMNSADRYANEVGNGVRNMLFRGTGTKFDPTKEGGVSNILTPWKDPNAVQKAALTVGVESFSDAPTGSPESGFTGVDRMRMQQARLSAWTPPTAELGKWKDLAMSGLDYAIRNWSRIEPTVRRYQAETRAQADSEIANGVDTLIRNGYVLHETDLEGVSPFDFLAGKRGTENASFLKNRVYPTYVDKIMSGSVPKSMDAIGLLKRRVQVGQRKINNRAWTQQMRSVLDETSGNPILTEPNYQTRADGKTYPVAPTSDYTVVHMGFEPYAIHKGYESVFDLLNSPSRFANSLAGQTLMKAVGSTKHIVLAFDTFHLGRLALWSTILQGKPVGYKKGLVLLDYNLPEIQEMIRRGEVPAEYGADLAENKRQLNLATKTGYNMTRIQDALWQDWVQKIPVSGAFNKWLFGQFQRGAMVESWLHEFQRQRRENPTMPEMDVARKVSKELNTRFGNLQNQGVFRSKTLQDVARFTFLAPQWNEGLIKSEIGALAGLGKTGYDLATKQRLAMNAFTRSAGILFLAQFAANQLINYVTRGHSTLDNPEDGPDAKLSAYVPDVVGEGPGLFISPMALPMETAHLIYKRFEKSKDFDEALRQYARTRLGTVSRPLYTWATSTDMFGRQIRSEELWKEVAKAAAPAPISGSAAFQAGRQLATGEKAEQFPGQFQRQAMASIGVKTEAAPTAVQQISSLARDFNKARGVRDAGRFPQSDYANLERYLRVGNVQDAAKELEEVRKKNPDTRIQKHFEALPKASFTRSSSDIEARFYNKLTDDQKKAYINARRERMELARRFWQLWPRREMNRPAPPE